MNQLSTVNDGVEWPEGHVNFRALDATFFLTALSALAIFVAKRTPTKYKISEFKQLSLARWLVIFALADSWMFVYVSGIMVLGVGMSSDQMVCSTGIWWCISLYASSKVLIYAWLMERVHIVYTTRHVPDAIGPTSRLRSRAYHISGAFGLLWIAVFICMVVGRISYISPSGTCIIGVKRIGTIPMLVDALVNCYLTCAFVIPIWKTRFTSARTLAIKSSIASAAALLTSGANVVIITVLHGKQLSWVCLLSCGLDVTINASILFVVTSREAIPTPTHPHSFVTGGLPLAEEGSNRSKATNGPARLPEARLTLRNTMEDRRIDKSTGETGKAAEDDFEDDEGEQLDEKADYCPV